jgi:2-C-methyl-D-erythritol 4-phosphate cytidylyltransferase
MLFDSLEEIDEIIIVVPAKLEDFSREKINCLGLKKKFQIKSGGKTRQDSVKEGLSCINTKSIKVLVHDGVRPFVQKNEIQSLIKELNFFDGAILGIPVVETIKKTDSEKIVTNTIPRENIFLAQTPQGFRVSVLKKAHHLAKEKDLDFTDDAALLENFGFKVKIVEGSRENIKITTPADLEFAAKLLNGWS